MFPYGGSVLSKHITAWELCGGNTLVTGGGFLDHIQQNGRWRAIDEEIFRTPFVS